jgi:hypothetical protein
MQSNTPPPRYRPPLKRPAALDGTSSGSFVGRCPHLGTTADAGTALAFASDAHRCYSTRLPVPVSAVHQQNYCLSGGYTECPVFQQSLRAGQPVPMVTAPPSWGMPQEETVTNVVITPSRSRSDDRRRSALLPLLLLLALLAGGWWLWRGFLSQPETTAQPAAADLAVGAATATPEDAALGSVTGDSGQVVVAANATATPVPPPPTDEAPRPDSGSSGISLPTLPTASAEAGVAQAAECSIPEWWVPYIVQSNDTLLGLAQLRGLAAEDVLQGNCLGLADLVAGQVILLPPLATVIGLTPFAPVVAVTRVPNTSGSGGGSIIIVATQSPATTQPIVPPPTPVATADSGFPDQSPTSAPPRPTSVPPTAVPPTVVPPTATPPILFPTATPGPAGPTATPPSTVPTATPPFEGPTQTPPPVRP